MVLESMKCFNLKISECKIKNSLCLGEYKFGSSKKKDLMEVEERESHVLWGGWSVSFAGR